MSQLQKKVWNSIQTYTALKNLQVDVELEVEVELYDPLVWNIWYVNNRPLKVWQKIGIIRQQIVSVK